MDGLFHIIVVTYVEHLKKILTHIIDSYDILEAIEDKPGDLAKIEKETTQLGIFPPPVINLLEVLFDL